MRYKIKFLDGSTKKFDSLVGADLAGANLIGANLNKANLRGVDLRGADLFRANLTGADLYNAALYGANLSYCKGIVTFQYYQHFAFGYKYDDKLRVKIGCMDLSISEWVEKWKRIGERERYSEIEIKSYLGFLRYVTQLDKDGGLE
jgi:hypothetical protein